MKKVYLVMLLGCGFAVASNAQSIERQVIGSAGGYDEANGISVSYTVGEPVVETAITGSVILTQGFQQPDDISTGINEPVKINVEYTVYPNPTDDHLFVEMKADKEANVMLMMYDLTGRRLDNLTTKVNINGSAKSELSLKNLAPANYILVLTDLQGNKLQDFKITKIN